MSDRARQKERKRLKREKKRLQIKRAQSVSPYQRIGKQGTVVECAVNSDWRERGQAVGFVLRRGPDGKLGMATFLVDLWCAGLKDIWGRLDVMMDDYRAAVDRMDGQMDDTMEGCELSELNAIVAGGIRFANQNGFRLPPHHERWAAFFGEVSPADADLTHFGVGEGKLRWVAPMHDLRKRYIGGTVEDFLARKDVEFILEADFDWDDDPEDEYEDEDFEEEDFNGEDISSRPFAKSIDTIEGEIISWCHERNVVPSPMLSSAIQYDFLTKLMSVTDLDDDQRKQTSLEMADIVQTLSLDEQEELYRAHAQVREYVSQIRSRQERSAGPDSNRKQIDSRVVENSGLAAETDR